MIVRATFDNDGLPTGFYPEDIWPEGYPDDAVEISEDHYQEFMQFGGFRRWGGSMPVPYEPPQPEPQVPQRVSKAQAKLALLEAGLLDTVEASLAAMEGVEGQRARIEWNDRTEFHRDHEFIGLLAGAIGLSKEQVDALFTRAAAL